MISLMVLMAFAQFAQANPAAGRGAARPGSSAPAMSVAPRSAVQATAIRTNVEQALGAAAYSKLPATFRNASAEELATWMNQNPTKANVLEAAAKVDTEAVDALSVDAQKAVKNMLELAVSTLDTLPSDKQQTLADLLNRISALNGNMNVLNVTHAFSQANLTLAAAAACVNTI